MTQEQLRNIENLYKRYCNKEICKPYDEYNPDAIQAIQQVLSILGYKIKGIHY